MLARMIPIDIRQAPQRLETIIVETTTWCSLRCAGCARTIKQGLGQWTDQHMTAETFRRIVDHMPPAGSICVQGTGEPTLNPDLPEIVGIAKRSGKYGAIVFSSHGLARDLDYYHRLTDAGLSYFRISVDSFDPIVAERLRSGTVVDKLKERIREFAESGLDFGVSITASTQNLWDIYKTLGVLDEIGRINRFIVGIQNFLFQPEVGGSAGPDYSSWVLDDAHTRMLSGEVHGWNQAFANIDIRYAGESSSSGEICASPLYRALGRHRRHVGALLLQCRSRDPGVHQHPRTALCRGLAR
jgi:hypothetical protein